MRLAIGVSILVLAAAPPSAVLSNQTFLRMPLGGTLVVTHEGTVEDGQAEEGSEALSISSTAGDWRANDTITFELMIDGGDGQYSVTPSTPGLTYAAGWLVGHLAAGSAPDYEVPVSVHAVDGEGISGDASFQVRVLPSLGFETPPAALTAYVDEPFSYLPMAVGVAGTPSWELVEGTNALADAGLSFSASTGEISGTPSTIGAIGAVQLRVTDSFDGRSVTHNPVMASVDQRSYSATVTSDAVDFDASTMFTADDWNSNSAKTLTIGPDVTIGASSTMVAALTIPSFGGSLEIINRGSVAGAGGSGGGADSPQGKAGGPAIDANGLLISIVNEGSILGGGGGGGAGGKGGDGNPQQLPDQNNWSAWMQDNGSYCNYYPNGSAQVIDLYWGNGALLASRTRYGGFSNVYAITIGSHHYECTAPSGNVQDGWKPIRRTSLVLTPMNGSDGGIGGMGQGSNNPSPTSGATAITPEGSAYGAAPGGPGGSGGVWGAAGDAGTAGYSGQPSSGTPGSVGGEAGPSIINALNVTVEGAGAVAGPVLD